MHKGFGRARKMWITPLYIVYVRHIPLGNEIFSLVVVDTRYRMPSGPPMSCRPDCRMTPGGMVPRTSGSVPY